MPCIGRQSLKRRTSREVPPQPSLVHTAHIPQWTMNLPTPWPWVVSAWTNLHMVGPMTQMLPSQLILWLRLLMQGCHCLSPMGTLVFGWWLECSSHSDNMKHSLLRVKPTLRIRQSHRDLNKHGVGGFWLRQPGKRRTYLNSSSVNQYTPFFSVSLSTFSMYCAIQSNLNWRIKSEGAVSKTLSELRHWKSCREKSLL